MINQKIRAQSLRVGDKLRARELRGTVITAKKVFTEQGQHAMHVAVEHADGTLACKDFALGQCLTILERESVS